MSDTAIHQRAMKKWAVVLYGLAGVYSLVIFVLISLGKIEWMFIIFPIPVAILTVATEKRLSRGCAIGLTAVSAVLTVVFVLEDGHTFPSSILTIEPLQLGVSTVLIVGSFIVFSSIGYAMHAFRFHRNAKTRILWSNVFRGVTVTVLYLFGAWMYVGITGGSLYDSSLRSVEAIGVEMLAWFCVALGLAIWRKLPGLRAHPIVVPTSEPPKKLARIFAD
ncbi:MAG: hypothetical protein H8E94_03685 [Alphaproteobacteria bacterium]|nr:hypothetical protein [Alphaproteobacteria bacterium]